MSEPASTSSVVLNGPDGQPHIPRWRGFNLTELVRPDCARPYLESDFEWLAEFGFDFARLPLSYWVWSDPKDWRRIDEARLEDIDRAVELGRQYGIHVNINFHRIPGYCVNGRELEPFDLFEGPAEGQVQALDAASHHWQIFAGRYKGISSERVSFDLMNEPPWMDDDVRYVEILRHLVAAIREIDPGRLIVADGADIGQTPIPGIVDLGLVQSTRGYLPKALSHYTATWVPDHEFESVELPTWPLRDAKGELWDRDKLSDYLIAPWKMLSDQGVPIHVGEWGCFNRTPHDVMLAWARDMLQIWQDLGWGWSMWNFRGPFGPIDSGREDVSYEKFRGHLLDRELLELLIAH